MHKAISITVFFLGILSISAQSFTRKDSLQGGLRPERTSFDILRYDLNIKVDPKAKFISGYNDITFKVIGNAPKIQIDLFENMVIDSIVFDTKKCNYRRDFNAVFIDLPSPEMDSKKTLRFYYSGNPIIAKRAPWDGGFVFSKSSGGKDWICTAVQGTGASLWFPCKDSQSDEPDLGVSIKVAVPNGLMNVSNGRLTGSQDLKNGYTRWDWEVKNPINSYTIILNIGDYIHFGENYKGLDLDYYVLRENEDKAQHQFEQVKPMMDCFQSKFGLYPFAEDSYKLVESNYLGMEHQSAIAYGNKFRNGYLGRDLSGTGVGDSFDYIIIHESGHEWFGNSITAKDIADMWIHEAFTCYSESVYLECLYGYKKAQEYINGLRFNIQNDKPITGNYGVNSEGSTDMYYKGALMLNTVRHIINDDEKWWKLILDFSTAYKHQIIDAETVFNFFNKESGLNLTPIFKQYLNYVDLPTLEVKVGRNEISYRWKTDVIDFSMPAIFKISGKETKLYPTSQWKTLRQKFKNRKSIQILENKFLMNVVIQN